MKSFLNILQSRKMIPELRSLGEARAAPNRPKIGLEAVRGAKTINEMGQEYGVHPVQVGQWKKEIQERAKTLFEGKRGSKPMAAHREPEVLYSEIGKLKVELDWLKKSWDQPVMTRQTWIDQGDAIPDKEQFVLSTDEIFAIDVARLKNPVGALSPEDRAKIKPAVDKVIGEY